MQKIHEQRHPQLGLLVKSVSVCPEVLSLVCASQFQVLQTGLRVTAITPQPSFVYGRVLESRFEISVFRGWSSPISSDLIITGGNSWPHKEGQQNLHIWMPRSITFKSFSTWAAQSSKSTPLKLIWFQFPLTTKRHPNTRLKKKKKKCPFIEHSGTALCGVIRYHPRFTDGTSLIELLEVILEWQQQAQAIWPEPVDFCTALLQMDDRAVNNLHIVYPKHASPLNESTCPHFKTKQQTFDMVRK